MLLSELLSSIPDVFEGASLWMQSMDGDCLLPGSRMILGKVQPGFLFVAVPGVNVDGHRYIPNALQAGAVAVVGEKPVETLEIPSDVPYLARRGCTQGAGMAARGVARISLAPAGSRRCDGHGWQDDDDESALRDAARCRTQGGDDQHRQCADR